MKRLLGLVVLSVVACLAGVAGGAWLLPRFESAPPDPPAVVEKIREIARLETLQLRLHKKISFEPDPMRADSMWGDVYNWVRFTLRNPRGRAIVFAEVDLGLDLERLVAGNLQVNGRRVELVLPPIEAQVRLLPGETEFIDSNLDSAETALLFDKAKLAFRREVMADERLHQRARASSERSLRALFITLGFREVVIHAHPPALPPAG